MLKTAFGVYRQWGYEIFEDAFALQKTRKDFLLQTLILPKEHQCKLNPEIMQRMDVNIVDPNDTQMIYDILKKNSIDIVFWYSWSWLILKPILDEFVSLCLHPSLLPHYRGGTPIQHQLINREKQGGVTVFKMDESIDGGPIYKQVPMSLEGTIDDIFGRMAEAGKVITSQLIDDAAGNRLVFAPQKNLDQYPPNKRRTPAQSEIKFEELGAMDFEDIFNKVRGLLAPYPNVFIQFSNGRLLLQKVTPVAVLPPNAFLAGCASDELPSSKNIFLKLKDGYAKIEEFKMENKK